MMDGLRNHGQMLDKFEIKQVQVSSHSINDETILTYYFTKPQFKFWHSLQLTLA